MADGYSWNVARDRRTYRLPGPEHLGWWAAVAMLLSILLHIAVYLILDQMKLALRFDQARELSTAGVNIRQVEISPMDDHESATPEDVVKPPDNTASLLEEVDLLAALPKDQPIDIKPELKEPEYALTMKKPAAEGDPTAIAMNVSSGLEIDADMPALGRQPESIKPAAVGQLTVDPGSVQADDDNLGKFTDNLIKRGANGKVEKGALDGIASLDDLLDLPSNVLLGKKTMLPSDLLFEFNSDQLRESAKVGLMKLALLMDRNPKLYCWIEGHTDLVGGDEFNLNLSIRRAESVKSHLVKSLRMDASRIITRGLGRSQPLVTSGTPEDQSVNRRVEIRMRNTRSAGDSPKITPPKAVVPRGSHEFDPVEDAPPPPKPVLVKPKRALPVDENPSPSAPKAMPVDDVPPPSGAPRATPIREPAAPPLRAEPVDE